MAELHAQKMSLIHKIAQKEDPFSTMCNDELEKCFEGSERKAHEGLFEERSDVSLCQWSRVGSNGLNLWLCKGGSTGLENFHQKLSAALGPWGMGACCSHHIVLLVLVWRNVQAGICCTNNEHNFGHPWLQHVDPLHTRITGVFDVDPFPQHVNLEQLQGIDGFVAAGIGPLSHNNDCVEVRRPHEKLKGDLKFTAAWMGLVGPPMHVPHPKEKKMFNDFLLQHPSPMLAQFHQLATFCKIHSDCVTVFLGLHPCMLKWRHKCWCESQLMVMAEERMKQPHNALLNALAQPVSCGSNLAAQQQGELSLASHAEMPAIPALGGRPANLHCQCLQQQLLHKQLSLWPTGTICRFKGQQRTFVGCQGEPRPWHFTTGEPLFWHFTMGGPGFPHFAMGEPFFGILLIPDFGTSPRENPDFGTSPRLNPDFGTPPRENPDFCTALWGGHGVFKWGATTELGKKCTMCKNFCSDIFNLRVTKSTTTGFFSTAEHGRL